jgi:hypothetical protein
LGGQVLEELARIAAAKHYGDRDQQNADAASAYRNSAAHSATVFNVRTLPLVTPTHLTPLPAPMNAAILSLWHIDSKLLLGTLHPHQAPLLRANFVSAKP